MQKIKMSRNGSGAEGSCENGEQSEQRADIELLKESHNELLNEIRNNQRAMEERFKAVEDGLSKERERINKLEDSLQRALDGFLPKVEALLAGHQSPAAAPSQPSPPAPRHADPGPSTRASGDALASLHQAAERGDLAAVRRCLADGGQVDARDGSGNTALHVAASNGRGEVADVLVANGSPVDNMGYKRRRPLHCAAAGGHVAIVARLVAAGTDVDARDADGATAAALAAQGHADVVLWLLEQGACVEAADNEGNTLLMYAVKGGNLEIVQYLLLNGASPTSENNRGESPLLLESQEGHGVSVGIMLKMTTSGDVDHLKRCLRVAGCAGVVRSFVAEKRDLVLGPAGQQTLVAAASVGRLEVVQTLLAAGVEASEEALWVAAKEGRRDCVVALLDAGADVNARDNTYPYDYRALHWAAQNGHADCVQELLRRGANKELITTGGDTAYKLAVYYNKTACIEILRR